MKQINVEEIVVQIREELSEKCNQDELLNFEDMPIYQELEGDGVYSLLEQMRQTFFIEWRPSVPLGIKGFIKKIICKLSGFLLVPIVDAQSNYNFAVLSVFENALLEMEEQKQRIDVLEKQLAVLENHDRNTVFQNEVRDA